MGWDWKQTGISVVLVAAAVVLPRPAAGVQEVGSAQEFAELGTCALESGGTIERCRVGYRTFGTLDADGSNAVLVPTWFGGTSAALAPFIRSGGLVDPDRYFVVIADALGNGVSSSPSSSVEQPGKAFPTITIGDMVESQHRLLDEHLGIQSLAGVVGISMGGMQVFEWAVRFPETVSAAVAIAGTPRTGSFDRIVWDVYLRLIDLMETPADAEAQAILAAVDYLRGTSPAFVERTVSPDSVGSVLAGIAATRMTRAEQMDLASQARAIASFDVAAPYAGDLAAAAARVRARLTVIATRSDHQVTPFTSMEFARLAGGHLVLLENDCGHAGANCESRRALGAVAATLDGTRALEAATGGAVR